MTNEETKKSNINQNRSAKTAAGARRLLAGLCLLSSVAAAQPLERFYPTFVREGRTLELATLGGLNNPQLSAVDLNGDGTEDLYIFDRTGGVHLTFIAENGRYRYAPEYAEAFPTLTSWVLLRDYDGDGAADLFAYSDQPGFSGIAVYRGFFEQGRLQFRRLNFPPPYNLLQYPLAGGGRLPIYVSAIDYPAVDDIDCDGDLDILTFNSTGGYVEFYRNRSVERGFGRDSLIFQLDDDCWGGFFESGLSPAVDLAPAPGLCASALQSGEVTLRHAGSTLLTFDGDGDGDRELVLGDLSFSNLNLLHNGGSCEQAWIDRQDVQFPGDPPVNLDFFPAAFYLDVTHDGRPDLLAAPNAAQEGENVEVLWLYENTGSAAAPRFAFRRTDWLAGDMIDLGGGAAPAFADLDGDGLTDLLVGNGYTYRGPGVRASALYWFRNTGSNAEPKFELVDDDYLSLSEISGFSFNFTPAWGDLDGDGDNDLLVGEELGQLFYAENIAGPGQPPRFAPWRYPYAGIDVGQASAPALTDINGDGLTDLLIGERDGNLNFFPNTGTVNAPAFAPTPSSPPNNAFYAKIDARVPGSFVGYSAPFVLRGAGRPQLLLGTDAGALEWYGPLPADESAVLPALDPDWGRIRQGAQTRPALADIDGDGRLELAVGNARGGLAFYRTNLPAEGSVARNPSPAYTGLEIFPNPARETVTLRRIGGGQPLRVDLFDAAGRIVLARSWDHEVLQLDVRILPAGLYLVRVSGKEGVWMGKVVVEGD
jgi:hypothetical protein